jgi:hypothetical protein
METTGKEDMRPKVGILVIRAGKFLLGKRKGKHMPGYYEELPSPLFVVTEKRLMRLLLSALPGAGHRCAG